LRRRNHGARPANSSEKIAPIHCLRQTPTHHRSQRRPSVSPRQPRYQDRLPCTTHPHSHPDESVLTPRQSGDAMIPTSLTRRTFLKTAALATAANSFASSPASRESLQQLPYNAVTLTGGPLKQH